MTETSPHDNEESQEHDAHSILNDEEVPQEEHVKRCLEEAEELKLEGNEHFRAKRWEEALVAYRTGLGRLPKRNPVKSTKPSENDKGKQREHAPSDDDENMPPSPSRPPEPLPEVETIPSTALEMECAKARSIVNANIGACYVKLGDHKEAVAACTEALADDSHYIKALQRRAASNEILNTWSSLGSAQEDYKTLLTLLPSSSPQVPEVQRALQSLKPRADAAQKRETDEMMDKLKGLGNSILGNFGMSTDNFKFVPNGQGGYSMNFVR
ncbi:TPR-like protein [Amylocystis lapponica]|nr:TPR-like protein [Amylocystis lapponica]